MQVNVITGPANEPITVAEAKTFLLIDSDDTSQDTTIGLMITSARLYVERMTHRALITQTLGVTLDAVDARGVVSLPRPPLASGTITSFKYYDSAGDLTDVDSTAYYLSGVDPARLVPQNGGWSVQRSIGSHVIVYDTGYGDDAADVPEPLREAVRRIAANLFEFREDFVSGTIITKVPMDVQALITPYRYFDL